MLQNKIKWNKIKDKFKVIQVTNFHNRSTGRLNPGIIESTHGLNQSSKQDDQSFISRYTRLPVTRWVKLSLNFELLVPK